MIESKITLFSSIPILFLGCSTDYESSSPVPSSPWTYSEVGLGEHCTEGSDSEKCRLAQCIHMRVDEPHAALRFTNICPETLYVPITKNFLGGRSCDYEAFQLGDTNRCGSPMWMSYQEGFSSSAIQGFSRYVTPDTVPEPKSSEESFTYWLIFEPSFTVSFFMNAGTEQCSLEQIYARSIISRLPCDKGPFSQPRDWNGIPISYDLILPLPQTHRNYVETLHPECNVSCWNESPSCANEPGFIYIKNVHSYKYEQVEKGCAPTSVENRDYLF